MRRCVIGIACQRGFQQAAADGMQIQLAAQVGQLHQLIHVGGAGMQRHRPRQHVQRAHLVMAAQQARQRQRMRPLRG